MSKKLESFSLPQTPQPRVPVDCQELPSVLQTQIRLTHARRLLRDNDTRMEMSIRERNALLAEREALQADVRAAALCYRDAREARALAAQGAGAVAEAWNIICGGMNYV